MKLQQLEQKHGRHFPNIQQAIKFDSIAKPALIWKEHAAGYASENYSLAIVCDRWAMSYGGIQLSDWPNYLQAAAAANAHNQKRT